MVVDAGVLRLSLPNFITWPHFRDCVITRSRKMTRSKGPLSGRQHQVPGSLSGQARQLSKKASRVDRNSRLSVDASHTLSQPQKSSFCSRLPELDAEEDDASFSDPLHEEILSRLIELYQVVKDTFDVLDVDHTGIIDISNALQVQKALSGGGLGQLWSVLASSADLNAEITMDSFLKVFLKWAGVDESSPLGLSMDRLNRGLFLS